MFDLPEDSLTSVDTENISQLMQSLDVFINVRHKPKQSMLSVIIKGIERNASNIYEARKQLLGLTEPRVHAEIPATYHIPNASNVFQGNSVTPGAGKVFSLCFILKKKRRKEKIIVMVMMMMMIINECKNKYNRHRIKHWNFENVLFPLRYERNQCSS